MNPAEFKGVVQSLRQYHRSDPQQLRLYLIADYEKAVIHFRLDPHQPPRRLE